MESIGIFGKNQIIKILTENNLSQKKYWGQNFIVDKNISNKIAKHMFQYHKLNNIDKYQIWEIGPGLASLTEGLLEVNANINLTLFEIDFGIIKHLTKRINELSFEKNISIIEGDALETIPLAVFNSKDKNLPHLICGNLPYSTGVRMLINIANESYNHCIPMSVMLQKESAERIASSYNTKVYGISSVLLQVHYDISLDLSIPASSFYPVPHIESVICNLVPNYKTTNYTKSQINMLQHIVFLAFSQRRKKLKNTLGVYLSTLENINKDKICQELEIDLDMRAENISPNKFMDLSIALVP